ncbi:MAG: nucleoside triphosphate pyrophosphohydrolase family protein [Candidatus Nanoarchaeia archaeon]|nr:nucleoside triphosphate pyrophosphohydrolase family protein [Candidatus Nanoarchaeia archaeon]
MNFEEYQKQSSSTAIYLTKVLEKYSNLPDEIIKYMGLAYTANGLGEVGEVQGKIKKILRDNGGTITNEHRTEIKKEIGDCLWYLAAMCNELQISLQDAAEENLKKLQSRKERSVLTGSGDNR